jgi:hypothetical protein
MSEDNNPWQVVSAIPTGTELKKSHVIFLSGIVYHFNIPGVGCKVDLKRKASRNSFSMA